MINDAMVGKMFSACSRAFPIAVRVVRYEGKEFKAVKVDESSEAKVSMWGAFPDYDCTVIVNLDVDGLGIADVAGKKLVSGKKVWLVDGIAVERRIGEVESVSDCYVKLGLKAEFRS
jgi:hypothetical protein